MTGWTMVLGPDGAVSFRGVPSLVAHFLLALPEQLDDDPDDAVRRRLAPPPEDDPARVAEWERLMVPELFALVASSRAVVEEDLALLARTSGLPGQGRLDIPKAHLDAWIHALQVARLSIGTAHGLAAADLGTWPPEVDEPERAEAILRVGVLGDVQGLLVDAGTRTPRDGGVGATDERVFDVLDEDEDDDGDDDSDSDFDDFRTDEDDDA